MTRKGLKIEHWKKYLFYLMIFSDYRYPYRFVTRLFAKKAEIFSYTYRHLKNPSSYLSTASQDYNTSEDNRIFFFKVLVIFYENLSLFLFFSAARKGNDFRMLASIRRWSRCRMYLRPPFLLSHGLDPRPWSHRAKQIVWAFLFYTDISSHCEVIHLYRAPQLQPNQK